MVKTGTAIATVTLDRTCAEAGLVTGMYITGKGVRDITNYPNLTTPAQITVTGANTFTVTWGGAVTATSWGGVIILANGGQDISNALPQNVQAAVIDATTGWLTLTGNTTWTGTQAGDYLNLYGARAETTGADIGLDGAWQVVAINTVSLVLKPLFDIFGQRISPNITTLASTNCGGALILRTTIRAHDMMFEAWTEIKVMIDGAGTTRLDKAIPVNLLAAANLTIGTLPATPAGTNEIGRVLPAVPPTTFFVNSAASTNGALILTGTSGLAAFYATNIGATPAFVKLYNKATAPVVGTDIPEMIIPVPAAVSGVPGVANPDLAFIGQRFPLGLGIAITGAVADTDTTAVAAGQVKVKIQRTT